MAPPSGFAALPQQDVVEESTASDAVASVPAVYDVAARDHTQRSLNGHGTDLATPPKPVTIQIGTALSPIDEHDTESLQERRYDQAESGTNRSFSEYYGPEDFGRTPAQQGTAYDGANYSDWEASYKDETRVYNASASRPPNFKPCVFQLWFLGIVLFIVCALLALAEIAVHTLPNGQEGVAPKHIKGNGTELRMRGDIVVNAMAAHDIEDDGEVAVNAFTAVVVSHDDLVTTTSLIPITTIDQNGSPLITTKTQVFTQKTVAANVAVITTTGSDGIVAVTTSSKEFSLMFVDDLEETLMTVATTMRNSDGEPTLTTSALVWVTPETKILTDSKGSPTATETVLVLNSPQTTTFAHGEGDGTSTATYFVITSSTTLTGLNGMPTETSAVVQTMTLSATTQTNSDGSPTKTGTLLVPASLPTQSPSAGPSPGTELMVFSITGADSDRCIS
ncbi:hypothetical protein Micbo1qcDRAFT_203868 [Microdochium bolleyi]|uniref:Uncharacterized protein n=1 Tax=Microdochium bolleyi TaxID=196109 RepID=A0A136J3R7_9PEZI|nr:hypothetical protein Micbo1qcDRAFT_203868 [Microdochium bolleyi]